MKAPDKIYVIRKHPEPFWFKDKQLDSDVEYVRKDTVDETVKTAEDHAYFAGQEKLREKLVKWAQEKLQERHAPQFRDAIGQLIDKLNSM